MAAEQGEDDEAVVSRLDELARHHVPRERAASRTGRNTGAAEWVRRLYDRIVEWRASGWSWDSIVDLLEAAAVPLVNKHWIARDLRSAMTRERRRREKRAAANGGKTTGLSAGAAPPQAARGRAEASVATGAEARPRREMSLRPPGQEGAFAMSPPGKSAGGG